MLNPTPGAAAASKTTCRVSHHRTPANKGRPGIAAGAQASLVPGTAAILTQDTPDADKALPMLTKGTRVIISYTTGERATVIVQTRVTARPDKGNRRAGLTTTGGKLRIVPLAALRPIFDGWQFFEPEGCIGSRGGAR